MSEDAPAAPVNTSTVDAAPVPKQERQTVFDLMPRKMAALALAGTVALSALATAREGDPKGFARAAHAALMAEPGVQSMGAEGTTADLGPLDHPFSLKLSASHEGLDNYSAPIVIEEIQNRELKKDLKMNWAEWFSNDPEAKNIDPAMAAMDSMIEGIQTLNAKGFSLEGVSCQGFASDEDTDLTTGGSNINAGLGRNNPMNIELANTRAKAVKGMLSGKMAEAGINTPIMLEQGQEVRHADLNKEIINGAKTLGESPLSLVQRYNRGDRENIPKALLEYLDKLPDDRFVRCVGTFSRIKTEFLPTAVQEGEDKGGDIIIVPFLIPLFRVRRVVKTPKERKTSFGGLDPALAGGYVPRREFFTDRRPAQTLDRRPFEIIKQPRNKNFSNRAQGKVGGRRGSDRDGRRGTRRG